MPNRRWLHLPWVQTFLIFVFALLVRAGLTFNNSFDGLYGQDAYAYFGYAREFANALARGALPPTFHWPLGYPLLLNIGFVLLGQSIAAAQWTTLLSGAAAASFTLLLAREVAEDSSKTLAGIVAGLVMALSGQAVQSSVVVMADAPALLWSAASAWLLLRYFRTVHLAALLFSTLALALALVTRWQGFSLAIAWFAALGVHVWFESRARKTALSHASLALLFFVLLLVPQLYYEWIKGAGLAGGSWVQGWSPANAFARSFDNPDGHFDYALPPALFYAQPLFHPAYLFPLLTPFALIGAWKTLTPDIVSTIETTSPNSSPIKGGAQRILLLGWIAATYIFLAGIPYENFRFGLGMLVPIATMTGIGVAWAWQKAGIGNRTRQFALAAIILGACVGLFIWQPRVLQPVLDIKRREQSQIQALAQMLPPNATVFTFGINGALETYTPIHTADVWSRSLDELRPQALGAPSYLFLDTANVETQWHGFRVEQNYHALANAGELRELRTIEGWTLFEIEIGDWRLEIGR